MTRLNRFCLAGLALGVVLLAPRADADVVNGSFEVGMSDWTTVGPNSAVPNGTINGFNATEGQFYAYLNTGAGAQSTLIQDFVLENVAGLPANYVASNFSGATEGATLFQQFTMGSNRDTLIFDWNFLTNEFTPDPTYNDFAFASLFSGGTEVASAYVDTFATFSTGGPEYFSETGWQQVTFGGLTPNATYTLVFGVFDWGDEVVDSALLIDNIRTVPEPSSLLLAGVAGMFGFVRRRSAR